MDFGVCELDGSEFDCHGRQCFTWSWLVVGRQLIFSLWIEFGFVVVYCLSSLRLAQNISTVWREEWSLGDVSRLTELYCIVTKVRVLLLYPLLNRRRTATEGSRRLASAQASQAVDDDTNDAHVRAISYI